MNKYKNLNYIIIFSFCTLLSCNMIDYHPYDVKIDKPININRTNIARIENLCANKDTIRFVAMGDSQGFYNETRDFVNVINHRKDIDFIIHGGDFTDYGTTEEFLWQRDILNKLKIPYVGLIGNHDCLGTGKDAFKTIWGNANFSFVAGKTKFVCLNTNAMEYDYSEAIPDFNFIIKEVNDSTHEIRNTIVCMHARPFSDVFNNNVNEIFHRIVTQYRGLQFCIHGHTHNIGVTDIFNDGILYYECPCIEKRKYLLFRIYREGYDYEVVEF